jgi:hypothetical protein
MSDCKMAKEIDYDNDVESDENWVSQEFLGSGA